MIFAELDPGPFWRAGMAMLLGMLIGLERQHTGVLKQEKQLAGIRTFSLVAILGWVTGFLADITHSPVLLPIGLVGVGAFAVTAQIIRAREGDRSVTTEVAFVLTFCVGAMVHFGQPELAGALAVAITLLLKFKMQLHHFARVISEADVYSVLKFGVITLIILPLVPDETYDPWHVLNPYFIWLMVVLFSGISFAGYILIQWLGPRAGIGLTGALGGIATSTGVTFTFSRRSRENETLGPGFAAGVALATTTMYLRLLAMIALVSWPLFISLWPAMTLAAVAGLTSALGLGLWARALGREKAGKISMKNPMELTPALTFAGIFAVALVAIKVCSEMVGPSAVLAVSGLTGLTGLDAIALSTARLTNDTSLTLSTAYQCILIACTANTVFKLCVVWIVGGRRMRWPATFGLGLIVAVLGVLIGLSLN